LKSNSIFVAALAAAGLASLSPAALAQNPPPTPLRGKIAAVDGHTVAVTTRNGDKVSVKLADPVSVSTVKPVDIATVKSGDFVGIAAEPKGKDASRALEVLVFPESMRGAGEGHYGWNLTPSSTMTNANVSAVVQQRTGRDLDLSYKGGTTRITVPPGTPVVTLAPAQATDLKPGAPVFLMATKQADGTFSAARITVGTAGVAPPM